MLAASVVVPTGVGLLTFAWWEDRPLREISALLESGDSQMSLKLADEFLARHPQDSRAQILKARSLSARGNHVAADSLFQRVALASNGFPDDAAAMRDWAESLLHIEQWSRAIALLETLSANVQADPEILYRLTVARIRVSRYDAALESAQQLAAISGHEDQSRVMIGTIHHDRGNHRAALDAWEAILRTNPDAKNLQIPPEEFLAMAGEELLLCGIPQRAADLLERSVRTSPAARSYALLGEAWSQVGRKADAIHAWETALQHEPLNSQAREELANVALQAGQPQQAMDLILPLTKSETLKSSSAFILQRAYTQLKNDERAEHWRNRANELREREKRRSTVKELLQNSTTPFWTGFLRAYQLADQQKWDKARSIISELLAERPDEPLLLRLAEAVDRQGTLPSVDELTNQRY